MKWVQMIFPNIKLAYFASLKSILEEKGAVDVVIKNYSQDVSSPNQQVIALFDNISVATSVKNILMGFLNIVGIKIESLEDKNWQQQAITNFSGINIADKLYIHPHWKQAPNNHLKHMIINKGLSFGSGKHSTTILCLEWIVQSAEIQGRNILDFGCGTGILAISALLFGANSVIATDIDPEAIKETKENAKNNNITNQQLQACVVDELKKTELDIVFANLYFSSAIITLKPSLTSLVKIGGMLLLSGFQNKESIAVEEVYSDSFDIKKKLIKNDWVLLIAKRRS